MNRQTTTACAPVVLLTGLSGSGKSTICLAASAHLRDLGVKVQNLDGDRIRAGLCSDLGYSSADRFENLRRIAHVAKILSDQDIVVFIAAIAPIEQMRRTMRQIVPHLQEVFVHAPLAICESRDPKGLYARARAGLLSDFTGVSAPFEEPDHPSLVCHTADESVPQSTEKLVEFVCRLMKERGQIPAS